MPGPRAELLVLHFKLVCSLHGGVYARAKEHARKSETSVYINSPIVTKKW